MALQPSPAQMPTPRRDAPDPRLVDLQADAARADVLLCGVPFDGAVLGRKGAAGGPTGIREAFRFLASHDPDRGVDLAPLRWHDLGDVADLRPDDTRASHEAARAALEPVFRRGKPVVVLGGDNSLSFPVAQALAQARGLGHGQLGLVVLDAHYDVRPVEGSPSSGTPYGRILTELPGKPCLAENLVEVGIRPFANTAHLAARAAGLGLEPITLGQVRHLGAQVVARDALRRAGDGPSTLWLSLDLDVLDQAVAPGVSAPGIGGMSLADAATLVDAVARDPRVAGMDLTECAPSLDPTGNTARAAAYLVAVFMGGVAARKA